MKHVLYTLLLCALFQGCGSSKSVREKTDRRIMSDSLVEIKGNFERREGEIRTDCKYSINSLVYWVTYVHNVVYSFYRSM
ncbi:hypothetical protein AAH022_12900, partial [Bacteroides fragilis]